MARQINAVQVNNFVGGLITEVSPLNFPANASLDEDNFTLNRDGSRERRLGMDVEKGFREINTFISLPVDGNLAVSSVKWSNAGGSAEKTIVVVQVGHQIRFFDSDMSPLSAGDIFSHTFFDIPQSQKFSYAVIDGMLVVATGLKEIYTFRYENGVINYTTSILYIRDQFGVTDRVNGENLRQGTGITVRPTARTDAHIYNLRNQTFAQPRKVIGDELVKDTIQHFFDKAQRYPSNSDTVTYALYADTNDSDDRLSERFNAEDVINNPVGTYPAPKGYFIIDAMARGTSRLAEYQKLMGQYSNLTIGVTTLPVDTTPGGATVVAEYAGRVFYAGFSGEIIGADENSPRMSSYLLFSQLVEDTSDINVCYQDGDPTSKDTPDLLDTDGGFIRIEGAYGIVKLINVGNALAVLATNGVWLVQGGSDYGFKATNYVVTKVTTHGCDSPGSVVVIDNTFMYWSDNGIYNVAPNQYGDYVADNISQKTIQKFYDNIEGLDRKACQGVYDTYEKKVRWIYANRPDSSSNAKELILDTTIGAFYPATIKSVDESHLPIPVVGVVVPPFRLTEVATAVTVNGLDVTVNGDIVSTTDDVIQSSPKEVIYAAITRYSPYVQYTFAAYSDKDHYDWRTWNGVGVDAKSYLLTGYMSGGDYLRNKQVPYLSMYFRKTEDGFITDVNGDLFPSNPSSCYVQAQWDWADNVNSGQWGRKFQAYRFKRAYIPIDTTDQFDNGYDVVTTRNKLRGKGKVLSLKIESEAGKHLNLLGWSMLMGLNSNV